MLLSREKKRSRHSRKTGSWYILRVLFRNFLHAPRSFLYGKPPGQEIQEPKSPSTSPSSFWLIAALEHHSWHSHLLQSQTWFFCQCTVTRGDDCGKCQRGSVSKDWPWYKRKGVWIRRDMRDRNWKLFTTREVVAFLLTYLSNHNYETCRVEKGSTEFSPLNRALLTFYFEFAFTLIDKRTTNKHVLCDFASCLQRCLVCLVKEREILSSSSLVESMGMRIRLECETSWVENR